MDSYNTNIEINLNLKKLQSKGLQSVQHVPCVYVSNTSSGTIYCLVALVFILTVIYWVYCFYTYLYAFFSKIFGSDNFNENMPRNLSYMVLVFGFYFMPFSTTCDFLSRLFFSLTPWALSPQDFWSFRPSDLQQRITGETETILG